MTSPSSPDRTGDGRGPADDGRMAAIATWALYILSIPSFAVLVLIGLVIAYAARGSASGVARQHLDAQIRLVWSAFWLHAFTGLCQGGTYTPALALINDNIERERRNEELVNRMLEAARQLIALAHDPVHHATVEPLSAQELRILKLFADGGNASAIGRELRISPQTLRNHLHRINHKLRTHNRLEAVTHARRRGLID